MEKKRKSTKANAVGGSTGFQLQTETKFMQQYRTGSAAHGGGDLASIEGKSGVEAFSIGTDQTVWNFYPETSGETRTGAVSTGLPASKVASGVDKSGKIVLFSANNLVLNYVIEQSGSTRWGSVQTATLDLPQGAKQISEIYTAQIGGNLYVGVLIAFNNAVGTSYSFAYSIWDGSGTFTRTTLNLSTLNCVWSGNSTDTAEFVVLDKVFMGYSIATGSINRRTIPTFSSRAVSAAKDSSGNNRYFAVLADGNLYQMVGGGSSAYSWAQITSQASLQNISAVADLQEEIHLFSLTTGGGLVHLAPNSSSSTGFGTGVEIATGLALSSVTLNDSGLLELFAVGSGAGVMYHMINMQASGNWQTLPVNVPNVGQVEEYTAYSTDVRVFDAAGAPVPGAAIQVKATSRCAISVNGANYMVDSSTPAYLAVSSAGTLAITQETSTLGITTLEISLDQEPQSVALKQFTGVQEKLGATTSDDLMNAKDAEGNYLLSDQYRTPETTEALASAFQECMALPTMSGGTALKVGASSVHSRQRVKSELMTVETGRTAELNRIVAPSRPMHWQLDFSGRHVVFRKMTAEEAEQLLLEKQAMHLQVEGVLDWIGDIGDFLGGVVDGVIDIIDTVVTTVVDGVKAVFTFVMDGVTWVFNTIVDVVEQAFDVVEAFFAQVAVIFQKIFEWIGFLFSWGDILRTHEALAYTFDQFLGFMEGSVDGLKQYIDGQFASMQGSVDEMFDEMIDALGADSTIGGYAEDNDPPNETFSTSTSNNLVLNATMDNAGSATSSASVTAVRDTTPFDTLTQALQDLVNQIEGLPQFQQALDYMNNLGTNPDQMFSSLLSALLRIIQGIIKAVLLGLQTVVDALFNLVSAMISGLRELFNDTWDIPFVTTFYSWLTDGSDLTLLDLFSLILAIPTTIAYKIMYNVAPFPDDASVTTFKQSFTSATMLSNSGFGPKTAPAPKAQEALLLADGQSNLAVFLGVGGVISNFVYSFISAGLDIKPNTGAGEVDPLIKTLSKIALSAEVMGQACSFPWFTSTGAPDCTTAEGAARVDWICGAAGVTLDCGYTWYENAFPENTSTDIGVGVAFAYGVVHTVVIAFIFKNLSGWGKAAGTLILVPELCKILKLTAIERASEQISPVVLAGADVLCGVSSAVCGFVDQTASD